MKNSLPGVLAALCTPIHDNGAPDMAALDGIVDFLLERGIEGFVIGGATAEYLHFSVDERIRLAQRAIGRIRGRGRVFVCIGCSSIFATLELTRRAADLHCDALLLPMPSFFRYRQDDLAAYCETVCASVDSSFFLYNLPSFTNEIEAATALDLLRRIPNLIGMKDSSGLQGNLEQLATGRGDHDALLYVGDDSYLLRALEAGWDGVVSGIACFAPELITAVYTSYREGNFEQAAKAQATLDDLIQNVVADLPIPWGVRVGLAARGIGNGPMHVPPSPARMDQIAGVRSWLSGWASAHGLALDQVWKPIG